MTRLVRAAASWAQAERAARDRAAEAARATAANPTPSPAAPAATDRTVQVLEGLVTAYARALESRNVAQVRRAYPGMNVRQEDVMRRLFPRAQDPRATLQRTDVRPQGDARGGAAKGGSAYPRAPAPAPAHP